MLAIARFVAVITVIIFLIKVSLAFFFFFVCLFAAVSDVEIRFYRGRITYGHEERRQLNPVVVIVQSKFLFVLVA